MAKSKSSIRKMRGYPVSRKLHHLISELASTQRRLEHLAIEVEAVEAEARALRFRDNLPASLILPPEPLFIDEAESGK